MKVVLETTHTYRFSENKTLQNRSQKNILITLFKTKITQSKLNGFQIINNTCFVDFIEDSEPFLDYLNITFDQGKYNIFSESVSKHPEKEI